MSEYPSLHAPLTFFSLEYTDTNNFAYQEIICLEVDDNVFEMEVESRDVLSALDVQELMNGRFQVLESDEEGEEC